MLIDYFQRKFCLDLFKQAITDPMATLVYQSNLWKLLAKVNFLIGPALVPLVHSELKTDMYFLLSNSLDHFFIERS